MQNLKYFLLILSLSAGCLLSCNNKTEPTEKESGFIEVTTKQFNTDDMQLGEMETVTFERTVKCNGRIIAPPDGKAQVSSPVSGMIKRVLCSTGQMVTLNQVLVEITGNEIIDLQRDFAESSAQLKKLKSEYERSKSLFQDKIMTEKEFIAAESDYKTILARFNSLKLKVETLGFSTAKIENGDYYTSYFVKSPIRGFVQEIKVNVGGFIDPHTTLAEITDPQKFQLMLSVFGKDISGLRKGQNVHYKTVDEANWKQAAIQTIGIAVQEDSKTIECIASLSAIEKSLTFVNTFVECEIITGSEKVHALPVEAIIKTDEGNMILVLEKQQNDTYFFRKQEVMTGRQNNGYMEVSGEKTEGKILVGNAYNISL